MESLKKSLGQLPETLVPDTGYGSEENYEYLENHHIEAFVKFNNFHKEQTKKWKENPHRVESLYYNKDLDCYYCPMGQPMFFVKTRTQKSVLDYKQEIRDL